MTRDTARVAVLCSVELVGVMGSTLVLTMLPVMLTATGAVGAAPAAAVSTGYAVGYGGFLVLGARLADRFGHVRALVVAAVTFAAAGLALVIASSVWLIAAARLMQGVAAAVLVPAALALIVTTVPEGTRRRRAMAAWGATSAAGGAIGFLVGSAAAATGGWRSAFAFQAGLGLALACLVFLLFHGDGDSHRPGTVSLDLPGGLLVTATLALVVAGASLLTTSLPVASAALGAAVATGMGGFAVERRVQEPLLRPSTLRKAQIRTGSVVSFLNTATTSSAATLLTLSLQAERGNSATVTALTMLPFSVAVIAGSACAPRLMTHAGDHSTSAIGLLTIGAGTALLPLAGASLWVVATGLAVSGAGIGLSAAAATHLGTSATGQDQAPAAAVLNTAAQLGTALGVAVSLTCAELTGHVTVWWALAVLAAAGAAWTAAPRRRRDSAGERSQRAP